MGKNILILGGGFGGLSAATELRRNLSTDHKITLVDQQRLFMMGLTKLWVINGSRKPGELAGNRAELPKRGIDYVEGVVNSIKPQSREALVGKQRLVFDYLIIALGADYAPEATPGFQWNVRNLYTESGCAEIRDLLQKTASGTINIVVCGLPFKCPPAPYEASMIVDDVLRKKGVRDRVKLRLITPEPQPLTILGPDAGRNIVGLLTEREIEYRSSQKLMEIQQRAVRTETDSFPHDQVFAVPIHVAPRVLKQSGLTDDSGWVPVDPLTMETKFEGIYAVGDCAGPKIPKGALLPRAGVLADEQGKTVAERIRQDISGEKKNAAFAGEGVCFVEVGREMAAPVKSNFYAQPAPKWEFTPPSREGFEMKRRFLEERMALWFPG